MGVFVWLVRIPVSDVPSGRTVIEVTDPRHVDVPSHSSLVYPLVIAWDSVTPIWNGHLVGRLRKSVARLGLPPLCSTLGSSTPPPRIYTTEETGFFVAYVKTS